MRITRTGSSVSTGRARTAKSEAKAGFSPVSQNASAAPASPHAAASTSGAATLGAVDAVMALQGVDTIGERRARALRKGRRLLDALDRLTLSMLNDDTSGAHLSMLRRAMDESRGESGDAGLDDALSHIEVRAAVEIAKLEMRRKA